MGCWTGYLLRGAGGVVATMVEKWGAWQLAGPADAEELFARARAARVAGGGAPSERSWFGASLCRGVAFDLDARRLRFYGCPTAVLSPAVGWIETVERAVTRSPAWDGWDAGYARGGREELGEVIPELAPAIEPEPVVIPPLAELPGALAARDDWFVSWDPARLELTCRHGGPWQGYGGLLSVVRSDLTVLDFGFAHGDAFAWLGWLAHGERLLDALFCEAPYPLVVEDSVNAGAVIDVPARRIGTFTGAAVPARLLAEIAAAWPGWRIETMRHGFAAQLAATGRRDQELVCDRAELLAPREHEWPGFDEAWVDERDALAIDPRPLRPVVERWEDP